LRTVINHCQPLSTIVDRKSAIARLAGKTGPDAVAVANPLPLGQRLWMVGVDNLFIYHPAHRGRKRGGDLLGGVSAFQETDLTGPISIFKLLP
jgi:hypothetical protein